MGLFAGLRLHVSAEKLLKAIALMVVGLPLSHVEKRVGIKAETIKGKLLWLLKKDRWNVLDGMLEQRFRIPESYRLEFDTSIVANLDSEEPIFRAWGEELRRREPADRAQTLRLVARIAGRPVKAIRRGRR